MMSYRRILVRRWSRRDRLAIVMVALTVAFLTGSTLLIVTVNAQPIGLADEFSSPGTAAVLDADAAPEDELVLPIATVTRADGTSVTVVGVPANAAESWNVPPPLEDGIAHPRPLRAWEVPPFTAGEWIIVLDEFPYLVEQEESLPSVLQAMLDHELDKSAATFILVGPSISMMEEAALLGNSSLYGRSSLKLDIRQLPVEAAMEFFDDAYTADEQVLTWGVFGGVPSYLEEVSSDATLAENIQQTILSRHGTLHDEPDYVLRMELTEPTWYFSILEAIAGGSTSRNEIAWTTGIDYNQLSKYLHRLSRLRLVDQHVPITEQKERSKRSRYRIRDPFFRFWFHFVYGTGDQYDELGGDAYEALIEPELAGFVSRSFEELCCSALRSLYPEYTITQTGQWWYGEHEIDVVGLTAGETLITGECKFQRSPLGYDVLSKLERHVDELRWTPNDGGNRVEQYALFSRSGFKQSVKEAAAERDDLRLFIVEDVGTALST